MKYVMFALAVLSMSGTAIAQRQTLRERVIQTQRPINSVIGAPMWTDANASLDGLLGGVDLVVRGVLGPGVAYLSEDGRDVLTDYRIDAPQFLAPPDAGLITRPGLTTGSVTITQLGGTMELEGQRVAVLHRGLPPLTSGKEGLFLLTRRGNKYYLAGDYLGAFAIEGDMIVPLTTYRTFAAGQRGKSVGQFVPEVVGKLQVLGR